MTKPTQEGYWWAIWKSKAPRTTDFDETPGLQPQIVYVLINCLDENDDEYLGVEVGGVEQMQFLENFTWLRPVLDKFPRSSQ